MSIKSIIVFFLVFSLQLLISCIYSCDCAPGIERSANYINGEVLALDTSGFNDQIVEDSVYRNSFGLYYQSRHETNETSEIKPSTPYRSLGFSSAFACSCIDDTYLYADPVINLDIIMIDYESKEETNVNDGFGLFIGSGLQSLEEVDWNIYFNQEWYPETHLNFELIDENAVLSSSVFRIVLTLDSGATLSSETDVIKFFD
ncbi:MAG: hypothetical protein AB8B73_10405 [Ekhidna sp.]